MSKIKVLIANPNEAIESLVINNTLADLQRLVGGYIETITLPTGQVLIINEDGAINGMILNRLVKTGDRILALHGPIVVVRPNGDDFTSVRGQDLAWFQYNSQEI